MSWVHPGTSPEKSRHHHGAALPYSFHQQGRAGGAHLSQHPIFRQSGDAGVDLHQNSKELLQVSRPPIANCHKQLCEGQVAVGQHAALAQTCHAVLMARFQRQHGNIIALGIPVTATRAGIQQNLQELHVAGTRSHPGSCQTLAAHHVYVNPIQLPEQIHRSTLHCRMQRVLTSQVWKVGVCSKAEHGTHKREAVCITQACREGEQRCSLWQHRVRINASFYQLDDGR
mmetsp:Transcript_127048/g.301756  ORF Transcript_127048/g.301756 Transcript_127048/m.301756 type:complete len:228 (-) Transcript_127048:82-765(-)